jgi:hypothetical protein
MAAAGLGPINTICNKSLNKTLSFAGGLAMLLRLIRRVAPCLIVTPWLLLGVPSMAYADDYEEGYQDGKSGETHQSGRSQDYDRGYHQGEQDKDQGEQDKE